MSSLEYEQLRGISGTALAARAALVKDPEYRSLLWWLHNRSRQPGGIDGLAEELIAAAGARFGTKSMLKFGVRSGKSYSAEQVIKIRGELMGVLGEDRYPLKGECKECSSDGKWIDSSPDSYPVQRFIDDCRFHSYGAGGLAGWLRNLCLSPKAGFDEPPAYFHDVIGVIFDFKRGSETDASQKFTATDNSARMFALMDLARQRGRMVLIEGLEGRGKSEAAKAYCQMHPGEARYVSLKGVGGKTKVFREIAKVLGIGCSEAKKSEQLQTRIEEVLALSKLLLVIDEAHWLFDPRPRMYARPELVDWVNTALCNNGVPVALITTPQFIRCASQAADQVEWNWRQFRRRVLRYESLAEKSSPKDFAAVARYHFPALCASGIKFVVGYAMASGRDLSAVGDVLDQAREVAIEEGREEPTFKDVEKAIQDYLIHSDAAFKKAFSARPPRRHRAPSASVSPPPSEPTLLAAGADDFSDEESPDGAVVNRLRGHSAPLLATA